MRESMRGGLFDYVEEPAAGGGAATDVAISVSQRGSVASAHCLQGRNLRGVSGGQRLPPLRRVKLAASSESGRRPRQHSLPG